MLTYTIANTKPKIDAVRGLISKVYKQEGYLPENEERSPIHKYLNKPGATTFLCSLDTHAVGTISLIQDMGEIPMDTLFNKELCVLRTNDSSITEVSQFAIDHEALSRFALSEREISLNLLSLIIHFSFEHNINTYVFAINPKHVKFYEFLGAVAFSEERTYNSVNGAPAIAYRLDTLKLKMQAHEGHADNLILRKVCLQTPPHLTV
ncbi:MAG TPA: hypothetical protein VFV22_01645 [Candidatus Paceibacterota bacterium]|nr:hypothetical protein [Candidatus Paceibacterota bacterium]